MCSRRENAAVFSLEHVPLRTERDPSVLAAWERSSCVAGTCVFAHGVRSKCAHSVRMPQCRRMNKSSCARREIQLRLRREKAAIFSPEHVSLCARREIQVCLWHASAAVLSHLSVVCGWISKWRGFHVCLRSSCPNVLLNMSPRQVLCEAGIPRVLG